MANMEIIEQDYIPEGTPKVYVIANSGKEALQAQEQIERKGGIRLTQAMRDSVIAKALDHKFKKAGEVLDKTEAKLAHRAMVAKFGKPALDFLTKIGEPYAYIDRDEQTNELAPRGVTWRVGELGFAITLRVSDPLPATTDYRTREHFVVKGGDLADAIVKWHEDVQVWKKERSILHSKLAGMLNTVTTFNSLQRTWPQGKKFWEHIPIDFPFRNQVPAIMVDKINEELGL